MRWVWVLALAGCPWVGGEGYEQNVRDRDGDGADGVRFGGPDCVDDDASIADCDADGDGFLTVRAGGDDCDDADGTVNPGAIERCNGRDDDCDGRIDDDDDVPELPTWYFDGDGDAVGAAAVTQQVCDPGAGWVRVAGDCNDADADVRPGVDEDCSAVDRNCDGDAYAGATATTAWYADDDGDGWGGALQETSCVPADPDWVDNDMDCDDQDASVATSRAFYADQDGDGVGAGAAVAACEAPPQHVAVDGDCDDTDPAVSATVVAWWDGDGDGFGADDPDDPTDDVIPDACGLPAGRVATGGDCDDTRATIFPGGDEVCNGRDDDCDGAIDDFALNATTFWEDLDADGFGNPDSPVLSCGPAPTLVGNADDCNDADPASYPGAPEICYDNQRQDCSTAHLDDCDADGAVDLGHGGTDCDDTDPARGPGVGETCDGIDNDCDGLLDDADPDVDLETAGNWYTDADGDGYGAGEAEFACVPPVGTVANTLDCADDDAAVSPDSVWYEDADGDGFGTGTGVPGCVAPGSSWVLVAGDCNDGLAGTHPGAPEYCDGVDNDCDGAIDDNPADGGLFWIDNDGDGFGAPNASVLACTASGNVAANDDDCNDADPFSYPDAPEVCGDGLRQDCSGFDPADCDRDGELDVAAGGNDCDDEDPAVLPGATEICDGIDNDCNGFTDIADPAVDLSTTRDYYRDADGDGHGDPLSPTTSCELPAGHVLQATDCDDTDPHVSPDALETCATPGDDDCDGAANDLDPEGAGDAVAWYPDDDGDGDGDGTAGVIACEQPGGTVSTGTDCDDGDPAVRPGASEVCDGQDNDCDGLTDDADANVTGQSLWYQDNDNDGFPRYAVFALACQPPDPSYLADPGDEDCNDNNVFINPNQIEACTPANTDDDCDGLVDAADPDWTGVVSYEDLDGDGYGNAGVSQTLCTVPTGFVTTAGDCNDADGTVNPASVWYRDDDLDGYGDDDETVVSCNPPGNWSLQGGDCHDGEPSVNPGAVETCDGLDNNCDGQVDDADLDDIVGRSQWYADADADGYALAGSAVTACNQPAGYLPASAPRTDCNDGDAAVNPGAAEVCNAGKDDDCDGLADTNDPGVVDTVQWYRDADGDGYGTPANEQIQCVQPVGFVGNSDDCNDTNAAQNPSQLEVCDAGLDNNCNGVADDNDPTLSASNTWYADLDDDGYGDPLSAVQQCIQPAQHVTVAGDCDDGRALSNPAATETCNALDDDCDGLTDDQDPNVQPTTSWVIDGDGDLQGALTGTPVLACTAPLDHVSASLATDCDDGDAAVFVGATEIWYDGVDQDCAGDDDFDQDGDFEPAPSDCDDLDPLVNHSATEVWYDGTDQDCDGNDADQDYDGYDAEIAGGTDCSDDPSLDSRAFDRNPGATEYWYDGIDYDCDGADDYDQDGDGFAAHDQPGYTGPLPTTDCRDDDAQVRPVDAYVPGDHATVQEAIDHVCGATIYVGPGTFTENLLSRGHDFHLVGAGRDVTVIDGGGAGRVLELEYGNAWPTVSIQGLTLSGGFVTADGGAGIYAPDVGLELDDVALRDHLGIGTEGTGIWMGYGQGLVLRNSVFDGIVSSGHYSLIALGGFSENRIEDTSFTNSSGQSGLGGADVTIERSRFVDIDVVEHVLLLPNTDSVLTDVYLEQEDGGALRTYDGSLTMERVQAFGGTLSLSGAVTVRGSVFGLVDASPASAHIEITDGLVDIESSAVLASRQMGGAGVNPVFVVNNGILTLSNTVVADQPFDSGAVMAVYNPSGFDVTFATCAADRLDDAFVNIAPEQQLGCPSGTDWCYLDDESTALGFMTYHRDLPPEQWDLHLHPDSPLIDAGTGTDPDGSQADIGPFGGAGEGVDFVAYYSDVDGDGLWDGWEVRYGLTVGAADGSPTADPDGDGCNNQCEFDQGTDPSNPDTDGDGDDDTVDGAPLDGVPD